MSRSSSRRARRLRATAVVTCAFLLATVSHATAASNALLDPAFGRAGVEMFPFATGAVPEDDEANAVALDAQGRAVIAGEADLPGGLGWDATKPRRAMAVARIDESGQLDSAFGVAGRVTLLYGGANVPRNYQDNEIFDVTVLPDGSILTAGDGNVLYDQANPLRNNADVVVAKLTPAGGADPSFGTAGFASARAPSSARRADSGRALAVQPDGKIVVAGFGIPNPGNTDSLVVRFNPNGTADSSFGTNGAVAMDFGTGKDDRAYDVALQPDGKIVIAGHAAVGGANGSEVTDLMVARLLPNGTLDPSFGNGGKVLHDHGANGQEFGWALELQPDGKILEGGYTQVGPQTDVSITRFNADGSVDRTFAGDGVASEPIGAGSDAFTHIELQPDGSILGTGYAKETPEGGYDMMVARFHADGSHDTTFGPDDYQLFSFGTGNDLGRGAALRPDGRLLVAGSGSDGDDMDFVAMQIRQPTATTVALNVRRPAAEGARMTATATVVSDTGTTPTGVVQFTACGPTEVSGADCPEGRGTALGSATMTPSGVATATARSGAITLTPGTWCIRADYAATASTVASTATTCTPVARAVAISANRRSLDVVVPEGATNRRLIISPPGRNRRPVVTVTPKAGTTTRISANLPASRMKGWFQAHRRVAPTVRLAYRLDGVQVSGTWRATLQAAAGRLRGQWLGKRLGAWDVVPPTISARQRAGIRGYPGGYGVVRQKPGASATFVALVKR